MEEEDWLFFKQIGQNKIFWNLREILLIFVYKYETCYNISKIII